VLEREAERGTERERERGRKREGLLLDESCLKKRVKE